MTREEAINELEILKEEYWDDDDYGHETKQYDDTMLALDMAIEALQDDWIPVSERLPEGYDQYLCYCEGGDCYVYWLDNEPWAEETVEKERIIAWQPLPAPYKGGDMK